MNHFFVFTRKHLIIGLFAVLALAAVVLYWAKPKRALPVLGSDPEVREIHMGVGEFSATTPEGQEIESYVFHPGQIIVQKSEEVRLRISGVNGKSHTFNIENTDISGEVKKGMETTVLFRGEKRGTYRLICHDHSDQHSGGPMIAYIQVI